MDQRLTSSSVCSSKRTLAAAMATGLMCRRIRAALLPASSVHTGFFSAPDHSHRSEYAQDREADHGSLSLHLELSRAHPAHDEAVSRC